MKKHQKYLPIIGLEVHAQLLVQSKMFAPETAAYGALPNTLVSTVSLAHPGTLPTINKKAVEYAIRMGLACHSEINRTTYFARKNYFYPDLPKGYQITQDQTPICEKGFLTITDEEGTTKNISLQRMHLEEDAGKSIHDMVPNISLLDFNRAGVALLEIVTDPVIGSGKEAYVFLSELRKLVRYLEICDGNMEAGSLRCDANISVKLADAETWGQRVEIKNMNSIKNVQLAIEYEIARQIELLSSDQEVVSETRRYDDQKGITTSQRSKEKALDYRYFIEPDLPPLVVDTAWINAIKETMPLLPRDYRDKFVKKYGLSDYAANVLTESKAWAFFMDELCGHTPYYTAAANWLIGPVKAYLNERSLPLEAFPIRHENLAQLIDLVEKGDVSFSVASQQLFPVLLEKPEQAPLVVAQDLNVLQVKDTAFLSALIEEVIILYPQQVQAYKKGKTGLLGLLIGKIMQKSQGKAAPALLSDMLKKALEEA